VIEQPQDEGAGFLSVAWPIDTTTLREGSVRQILDAVLSPSDSSLLRTRASIKATVADDTRPGKPACVPDARVTVGNLR